MSSHSIADLNTHHKLVVRGQERHYEPYRMVTIGPQKHIVPEKWAVWYLLKNIDTSHHSITIAQAKELLLQYLHDEHSI